MYLPTAHQIAVLDENIFNIYSKDMELLQQLSIKNRKEKILAFALNMAVYRPGSGMQSHTDQIVVTTNDKRLYIFNSSVTERGIIFEQDMSFCFNDLPFKMYQIYWDNDRIYCGGKEGFLVVNKSGQTLISYKYDMSRLKATFGRQLPLMAVNRNRCLVQTKKREKAKFLVEG